MTGVCLALAVFAGIATGQPTAVSAVFAADGAGNFQVSSRTLRTVAAEDHLPLEVHTFEWSHGYLRVLSDEIRYRYAREQGGRMAAAVLAYHADHPGTPIYLYGHSAGCAVVLAAAEELPSGVVEGVVLLAPSLSASYDLGPALAGVHRGLHVFYSRNDFWYLGLYMRLLGTADGRKAHAAGRVGFLADPDRIEPELLDKLRQHAWQPEDRALGHLGGHYGCYQPAFLRTHVLPLLLGDDPTAPVP
jgi:pimeloyl-ACP methyl ester carboxylesterase